MLLLKQDRSTYRILSACCIFFFLQIKTRNFCFLSFVEGTINLNPTILIDTKNSSSDKSKIVGGSSDDNVIEKSGENSDCDQLEESGENSGCERLEESGESHGSSEIGESKENSKLQSQFNIVTGWNGSNYVIYGPLDGVGLDFILNLQKPINKQGITNQNKTRFTSYLSQFTFCGTLPFCDNSANSACINTTIKNCNKCSLVNGILFMLFLVIFGLVILIANMLIIAVVYRRHRKKKINKIDIIKMSLAIADLLTGKYNLLKNLLLQTY